MLFLQTFHSVALSSPPEWCKTLPSLVREATWSTSSQVHSRRINNRPLRLDRRILLPSLVREATWSTSSQVHSRGINNRPLRLDRRILTHAGSWPGGSFRNPWRWTPASRKSVRGIQRDGPNQICSNHAQNERHAHEIKERKEEQGIREKTAPDDELQTPPKIQERIRRPALRVALPDFQ